MSIRFLCFLLAFVCLAQDEPKQRVKTARELAKQGAAALPKLQEMLRDPATDVRVEAVKSIVEIGSPRSVDPLIEATRDNDPEVQIRATDGLVNYYLPGYVQTGLTASLKRVGTSIKGRFTDVNDQVIEPFVEVRPDVVAAIGKLSRGGASMDVRANAARALGVLRGKDAIPDLLEAMRAKDDQVIYESLVAFQKIRDGSVAPKIAYLMRDLNEKVQIAVIETTGLLQNREALPQLREAYDRARTIKVRRAALTSIAMLPDPASRDLYVKLLEEKDDGLRAAAAEGLGRLKNPQDAPMVQKLFDSERKMSPRLSQAFALVNLGKREVSEFSPLQYLVNTLNSKSYRGVASAFLVELTREGLVRLALYPVLQRGTRDEKTGLAQVLARSGDRATLPYLEALSKDSDIEVAQEGLRALRTLRARLPNS